MADYDYSEDAKVLAASMFAISEMISKGFECFDIIEYIKRNELDEVSARIVNGGADTLDAIGLSVKLTLVNGCKQ